jgi:DNA-binding MurR/RpiR family transcriptional regulator
VQAPSETVDTRIARRLGSLTPAEQAVAAFLRDRPAEAVMASAAQIAAAAGTSDATVVRAVQAMGFAGLADLRRALLSDLQGGLSPAARLRRSLQETGADTASALDTVLQIHHEAIEALRDPDVRAAASRAVDLLGAADRIAVFGIGPSRALADYFAVQARRLGRSSVALTATGVFLADELLALTSGDVVILFAYSRRYREVLAVLDQIRHVGARAILVTDGLGAMLRDRVQVVLPARRGRAGRLAMHGATFVLIEALLLALAVAAPDRALQTLARLDTVRAALAGEPVDVARDP